MFSKQTYQSWPDTSPYHYNVYNEYVTVAGCLAGLYVHVASPLTVFKKCYQVGNHEHCFQTVHGQDSEKKSWSDAWSYCEGIDGSYSLAAVDEIDVRVALDDFIQRSDLIDTWMWLGLDQTTKGQWSWIDQTTYSGRISAITCDKHSEFNQTRRNEPINFELS